MSILVVVIIAILPKAGYVFPVQSYVTWVIRRPGTEPARDDVGGGRPRSPVLYTKTTLRVEKRTGLRIHSRFPDT